MSNSGFVFHNVIAEKEQFRPNNKEMSILSQRTAVPYFHVIENFAQKSAAKVQRTRLLRACFPSAACAPTGPARVI